MNTFRTLCLFVASTALFGSAALGQLLTEDFSYTAGDSLTAHGWTVTGTNANPKIFVSGSSLSYSSYLGNAVGNAALVDTAGQDINRTFTTQTTGDVYASMMVNLAKVTTGGDYFFNLGQPTIGSTFHAKVHAKQALNGNIKFGITKTANTATASVGWSDSIYTLGSTYFLVVKYTINAGATNDKAYLFVNPALGGSEPAFTAIGFDSTATDLGAGLGSVALRQGAAANAPRVTVDGIRVGTTWADVTPGLLSDQYRSFTSGNWNATGTWEVSTNGGGSWNPAAATPTSADDAVTILATHTVTVTASVSVDQVTVATGGTLHVNSGNTLTVDNGTGTDVTVNGTLSTAGTVSVTASAVVAVNGGAFQINAGGWGGNTGSYTYDAAGTLVFNTTAGFYGVGSDAVWWPDPISNVTVQNFGGVELNVSRTVTGLFQTATGVKNSFGNNLFIDGTLQMNSGAFFDNFSPTYGGGSTLRYNANYGPYNEWTGSSATAGYGVPNEVIVQNGAVVTMPNSDRGMAGDMHINNGTLALNGTSGNLYIGGDWNRGATGVFTPNGRTVHFNGAASSALTAAGGETFDGLVVNKSANVLDLNDNITVNGNLNIADGTLNTFMKKVTLGPSGTLTEAGNGDIVLGFMEATRTIASTGVNETFGNIGMELLAVSGPVPGATTVERRTGQEQFGAGNQSIKRYYTVTAGTSTGLNATMVFHYDDTATELNTNVEPTLSLWRSTTGGSSWLTSGGSTSNNTVGNTVTVTGVSDFSRWTAADATHPLATAASTSSDVVAIAASEAATISSLLNTAAPLTLADGEQVWQLSVRDGGGAADGDAFPTALVAFTITQSGSNQVTDWSNAILAADLFEGPTWLASGTVGATSISFPGLSVSAPDGLTAEFELRISLKDPLGAGVADNQHFGLEVLNSNVTGGSSLTHSQFAAFSPAASNAAQNAISVVATNLAFTDQPAASAPIGGNLAPVAVAAQDANGNTDTDFANAVTLSSGTFTLSSTDGGGLTQTPSSGVDSWTNLSSSNAGTGTVLANATGVLEGASSSVTVLGASVTSAASGDWNVGATWVGGSVPAPTQSAIIAGGHTVTLTANDTCAAATVQSGGVLDIAAFQLRMPGTYTILAGGEGRQGAFNPIPGGGGTPWAFDAASTYTIGGNATGFTIGAAPGITFGNLNWSSTGNATPPVGVVVQGNLVKSNVGQLRGGTGATSRVVVVNGNVTVNGGFLYGSNSATPATGGFDIAGDLIVNPGGTLGFNLSTGPSTIQVGGNVTVNDTGKVITGAGSGAGTLYFKGTSTTNFDPGAFATNTFKNIAIPAGRTVHMIGNDVTIASTYTLVDSGTLSLGTHLVKGAGSFSMAPGATLAIGSPTGISGVDTSGNVRTTGGRTFGGSSILVYNGTVPQISGDGIPLSLKGLTIDNPAGVKIASTDEAPPVGPFIDVSDTLKLTQGVLTTNITGFEILPGGTVVRTGGHVNGNLTKTVTVAMMGVTVASGPGSMLFEIGDSTNYAPVLVEGSNYASSFSLTVSTTPGEHADIAASGIDPAQSVNRYYTIAGSPTGSSDITFNFVAGDIDGGASTGSFIVGKYDFPTWTLPTVGTRTATSTQVTGITSFSDFAIGEPTVVLAPAFTASASSINFGNVDSGATKQDSLYVKNTGTATLNILSATSDDVEFVVAPPSAIIAAGDSAWFHVTYGPTAVEADAGNIVFGHDAASSPDTVTVSGNGVVPGASPKFLSVSPDTIIAKDPVKLKFLKPVKRAKPGKPITMPNWANLLDETVAQGGFGPGASTGDSAGGMVIGESFMFKKNPADPLKPKWSPVKESANLFAWVRLTKWDFKKNLGKGYNALQKTLENKTFNHMVDAATHRPRGFDSTLSPGMPKRKQMKKQATKLDSKKTPNNLFAELVALKVNIAASQMEKTPAGFGELIFDVDTSAFDEMEVKAISEKADSMMTHWQSFTPVDSAGANYSQYDDLYNAAYAINRAFVGVLDTASFMQTDTTFILGKLRLEGQVSIDDVPYMKLPVLFRPVTIAATTWEVESGEEEDFLDEEWENETGVPVAAKLYQNYPNPFNPSTKISFQLLETSQVTVKIFNMLGQEVASLFSNEEFEEGYNTVQFDATGLASGVYFYQIQAQGIDDAGLRTVATQKMVLLK